jgi:hypothetical protein
MNTFAIMLRQRLGERNVYGRHRVRAIMGRNPDSSWPDELQRVPVRNANVYLTGCIVAFRFRVVVVLVDRLTVLSNAVPVVAH